MRGANFPPSMGPEGVGIVSCLIRSAFVVLSVGVVLASCAETQFAIHTVKLLQQVEASAKPATGRYKIGDPYQINGVYYYPAVDYQYSESGVASWYGPKFDGKATANGEIFDMNELSAAHRTLPMPSMVRVVNLDNGRSLALRINDRGPFARGRIIDVSRRAAQLLGFRYRGTARVKVELMADESRRLAMLSQRGRSYKDKQNGLTPVLVPNKFVTTTILPPLGSSPQAPKENSTPPPMPAESLENAASPQINISPNLDPVRPTALYVQAGAFVRYPNAVQLRIRLARVAPAQVTEARVGNQKYFRVRLGPFQNLGEADQALAKVAASGYPRAQLIVD